jgi:hypothetical protein
MNITYQIGEATRPIEGGIETTGVEGKGVAVTEKRRWREGAAGGGIAVEDKDVDTRFAPKVAL